MSDLLAFAYPEHLRACARDPLEPHAAPREVDGSLAPRFFLSVDHGAPSFPSRTR